MVAAAVYSSMFVFLLGGVFALSWNGLSFLAIDSATLAGSSTLLLLLIASALIAMSITLFLRRLDVAGRKYSALERDVLRRQARRQPKPKVKPPNASELKALKGLGVNARSTPADIRQRYVTLIRKYHPDTNNGDRSRERQLGQTVRAYRLLCRAGRA
jgi:hypothetical protein